MLQISEKDLYQKKRDYISIVKNRERGGSGVFEESIKEEIYLTIKVITDITSVICTEERWKEEDGVGLLISKQSDNQE